MKALFSILLLIISFISYSQSAEQGLSKDSIKYYRSELSKLYQTTYDSLRNSEKYKFLTDKLKIKNNADNFGVELIMVVGYQKNDYANLSKRLASLNLNEVKSSMNPIGIGLAFRFNKFIIGYDMSALLQRNGGGFYIHAYLSTNLIRINRFILSPQIGYGAQNVVYRYQTQSFSTNFNSYFTTSPNKVEIEHSNSVLDFALAFKLYPKTGNENYLSLFRIGYRHGLSEKAWEISDGNSANAPLDRNNNFYLQLVVGVGN